MTTPEDKNLLQRPPRLKQDGTGYDWKEFDRYLQKISAMLGLVIAGGSYNVPEMIAELQATSLLATYDTLSHDIGPAVDEVTKQIILTRESHEQEDRFSLWDLLLSGENPTFENRIKLIEGGTQWPIGSIFISVVSTNPATLLGFGTWTAFGTGQTLIGIDTGDVDFDTVEEAGGAKTHKHSVDVGATTSGAPSSTVLAITAAGTDAVGDGTHTHPVDPAAVDSTTVSNVPPYLVVYMWKRTT